VVQRFHLQPTMPIMLSGQCYLPPSWDDFVTVANNATQIVSFALAQKHAALHIEQAFQASSPKPFKGSVFGPAPFFAQSPAKRFAV
jgi:hypothetical protein